MISPPLFPGKGRFTLVSPADPPFHKAGGRGSRRAMLERIMSIDQRISHGEGQLQHSTFPVQYSIFKRHRATIHNAWTLKRNPSLLSASPSSPLPPDAHYPPVEFQTLSPSAALPLCPFFDLQHARCASNLDVQQNSGFQGDPKALRVARPCATRALRMRFGIWDF